MQKEGKKHKNFVQWYKEKQEEMGKDQLMKYFKELRNYTIKEGDNRISKKQGIGIPHLLSFNGKGNCIATIKNRDGQPIKQMKVQSDPSKPHLNVGGIAIPFDSGLWEKIYMFDEIEGATLEFGLNSCTDLSYEYLKKLRVLVNEYIKKFMLE